MNEKEFYKELNELMPVKVSSYKMGVTGFEFILLKHINDAKKEITGAELSKLVGFTKVYISRTLLSLEEKELIEKKSNVNDKRSMLIRLSEKGKNIINNAYKKFEESAKELFKVLGEEEAKKFIDNYKLANNILN